MSASGMRGEHALTVAGCGEEGRRGEPLRCCRVGGQWGYHCSSRNNVNIEQARDRCFVEKDRRQRKIEQE